MKIQPRTYVTNITTVVPATPAVTSTLMKTPASPFHAGASLGPPGTSGAAWTTLPQHSIGLGATTAVPAGRLKVAEAKDLIRRADQLRLSELPSDRSEAYRLIREAAAALKGTYPELAKKFEDAAGGMFGNDLAVQRYAFLKLQGLSTEEANQAVANLGLNQRPSLQGVYPVLAYEQAKEALARL
jgi:hypothetical protein